MGKSFLTKYGDNILSELFVIKKRFIKVQIGDVYKTHAEIKKIKKVTNYSPKTKIEIGLKKFINWYKEYYQIH